MSISQTELKRLAFIKYLHQLGNEQTRSSEPLSSVSILTFHDSVELFLQLLTDNLGINKPTEKIYFLDYWDLLAKNQTHHYILPYKNEMNRLNKIRVQLKHHGVLPSKQAIDEAKVIVNLFFETNTKQVFNLEYSEISLVDLVILEEAKILLKTAEKERKSKNLIDAIQNISLAFFHLTDDYEKRKVIVNRSPFYFGYHLYRINRYGCENMDEDKMSEIEIELHHHIETLYQSIRELTSALKIIALGIDYRKYSKFDLIVPDIQRMKTTHWDPAAELKNITEDDVDFCFNFVIECSLKLGEFDYDLKREVKTLDFWMHKDDVENKISQ